MRRERFAFGPPISYGSPSRWPPVLSCPIEVFRMSYRSPAPAQPVLHGKTPALELPETLRRRLLCGERGCQDRRWVAGLPATIKSDVRAFPEGLQPRLCHEGVLVATTARPSDYSFDSFGAFQDSRGLYSHFENCRCV